MRVLKRLLAFTLCLCAVTTAPSMAADPAGAFAPVAPGHRLTFPHATGTHPAFRPEW